MALNITEVQVKNKIGDKINPAIEEKQDTQILNSNIAKTQEGLGKITVGTTRVPLTFSGKTNNIILISDKSNSGATFYIGDNTITSTGGGNVLFILRTGAYAIVEYDDSLGDLYIVCDLAGKLIWKGAITGDGRANVVISNGGVFIYDSLGNMINPATSGNQVLEISAINGVITAVGATTNAVSALEKKSDYLFSMGGQTNLEVDFPPDNDKLGHKKCRLQVNNRSESADVNSGGEIYQVNGDDIRNASSNDFRVDINRQFKSDTLRALTNIEYSFGCDGRTSIYGNVLVEVCGYNKALSEYQVLGRVILTVDAQNGLVPLKNNQTIEKSFNTHPVMDWDAVKSRFGYVRFVQMSGDIRDSGLFFSVLLTTYQFLDLSI